MKRLVIVAALLLSSNAFSQDEAIIAMNSTIKSCQAKYQESLQEFSNMYHDEKIKLKKATDALAKAYQKEDLEDIVGVLSTMDTDVDSDDYAGMAAQNMYSGYLRDFLFEMNKEFALTAPKHTKIRLLTERDDKGRVVKITPFVDTYMEFKGNKLIIDGNSNLRSEDNIDTYLLDLVVLEKLKVRSESGSGGADFDGSIFHFNSNARWDMLLLLDSDLREACKGYRNVTGSKKAVNGSFEKTNLSVVAEYQLDVAFDQNYLQLVDASRESGKSVDNASSNGSSSNTTTASIE